MEDKLREQAARLTHQASMAETKEGLLREQYDRKLELKDQEHAYALEMVKQQSDDRFERSEGVACAATASLQAGADKKRRELEQLLRESNLARKEQAAELENVNKALEEERDQSKRREAVAEYQLQASANKVERLDLEKTNAETRTSTIKNESDLMRRTLEGALREADNTTKTLREDLERVNRKYTSELNASREQVFALKEQLTSVKTELDESEGLREQANDEHHEEMLMQSKVTERVQLELASSRNKEEHLLLEKSELLEKIRQLTAENQRLSTELDAEKVEHSVTRSELVEAKANAQAIHREKLETLSEMRAQLVRERSVTESVTHEKELVTVDLRRAAEGRDSARRELAIAMRKNMAMNKEAAEANKLSEGLKYRMQEVSAAQEQALGGPTFHPRFTSSGASASKLSPRLHHPAPSARYAS
eukprot:TRINITY_DN2405_c0_g1_i5.p1 TRINITY_DN2405_c0_g1~~TRINITY_DN2405_c0_g1_i5.p1  ORF type:complete len:424 (-),score=162.78 TRINITY_DN2405_c0_g1_i5:290-1561(-)